MTDIIIQGIYGRMGRALVEKIAARTDCRRLGCRARYALRHLLHGLGQ